MPRLARSVASVRPEPDSDPLLSGVHPLTVSLDAVMCCLLIPWKKLPELLSMSLSSLERLDRLGLFPKADVVVGSDKHRSRFYRPETITNWVKKGGVR
jgi:hypothetical protein